MERLDQLPEELIVEDMLPREVDRAAQSEPGLAFTLRLGQALHAYGVPAHRLEQAMSVVAARFGLAGRFYSTPTAIIASFGPPEALRTSLIRVEPGEVDLGRLAALDELTGDVIQGHCDPAEAEKRMEEILHRPPLYGRNLTLVAFTFGSGGAGYLLGGGLREMVVAGMMGMVVGLVALLTGRMPFVARMMEGVGAFVVAALAIVMERLIGTFSVQLAIIAGLIVLLPGLTLTVALTELATRNLVSGTARATSAMMVFLQMGFGVALATQIGPLLPPVPDVPPAPELPGWFLVPALLLGVGAFPVLFRARKSDAIWILLAGSLAYFSARLGSSLMGPQLGAFLGSFALAMASNALARLKDKPAVITILPGLLLLVPGSVGFRSMDALLARDVLSGVETAFNMALVAVGLVAGLLLANVVVEPRKVL